jgi:hypothetical protein
MPKISLMDLSRNILLEFKPILAKMSMDSNNNQAAKVTFYLKFLYVLLHCMLFVIMFLIDDLVAFAN